MRIKEVSSNALESISASSSLEEMKTAVEIAKLSGEIDDLDTKSRAGRFLGWADRNTAVIAVLITAITLMSQVIQFAFSSGNQSRTAEDQQWRDAVKSVSLTDTGAALTGILNLETFYGSVRYSGQARVMAASSMPYVTDKAAFDAVFQDLKSLSKMDGGEQVVSVARGVTEREEQVFDAAQKSPDGCGGESESSLSCFREYPSWEKNVEPAVVVREKDKWKAAWRKEALLRDWEIDSVSSAIVAILRENRVHKEGRNWPWRKAPVRFLDFNSIALRLDPKPSAPGDVSGVKVPQTIVLDGVDLSGMDFTRSFLGALKFSGGTTLAGANLSSAYIYLADFGDTDLSGANFENATIECSDLGKVTMAVDSRWANVDFARARNVSKEVLAAAKVDHVIQFNSGCK